MPLPAFVTGAPADVRGTLVAVHFRDERGFAIFSLEQPDGSRVRALGQLPAEITLQAVVRNERGSAVLEGWRNRLPTSGSVT